MAARSSLGALTTYTEIRRSPLCREHVPALVEAAATIGAAQIQNRGTLGGNIANASPAGDTLPVLLAADAVFVLGSARGEREVAAAEFWTGYRQTALPATSCVAAHPHPARDRPRDALPEGRHAPGAVDQQGRAGGRLAFDAGAVASGAWRDVRVALGSVAATPIRAPRRRPCSKGRAPTPETADLAAETLAAELSPIDDVRSTAEYRRLVAARDPPPHRSRGRRLVNDEPSSPCSAPACCRVAPRPERARPRRSHRRARRRARRPLPTGGSPSRAPSSTRRRTRRRAATSGASRPMDPISSS